jgi:hypothetical protein
VTVMDPAAPQLMAREWPEARSRWVTIGTRTPAALCQPPPALRTGSGRSG